MTIFCDQKLCHREDYLHKKFGIYCSHVWALVNFPKSSSEFSKKSRLFHVQSYKSKVFQLISLKFWGLVEGVLTNNHWKFQVNIYYITGVIVICWKKFIFRKNRKKSQFCDLQKMDSNQDFFGVTVRCARLNSITLYAWNVVLKNLTLPLSGRPSRSACSWWS